MNTRDTAVLALAAMLALFAGFAPACALEIPDTVPSWKNIDMKVLTELVEYGELVSVEKVGEEGIDTVCMGALADVPPEKVWDVITDFEGYSRLLPDSVETKILKREGNSVAVGFKVTIVSGTKADISTKYTLKYTMREPTRVDISWLGGDVKNVAGYWQLFPVDNGRKTFVIYVITSDLSSSNPLFGDALAKQPALAMAVNLSSAIVLTQKVVETATGKPLNSAPAGTELMWKSLDHDTLYEIMKGGRTGFIFRLQDHEIATAGLVVNRPRDHVWKILTSFEEYPEHLDRALEAKVLEMSESRALVQTKMEYLSLGPFSNITEGVWDYTLQKPEKIVIREYESKRMDLFNIFELIPAEDDSKTILFYSQVTDISELIPSAKRVILERIPALQISIDLSSTLIVSEEFKNWAEM